MTGPDRHFRIDEVRADLGRKSVRSGMVATAGRGLLVGLQVASTMVLARLLTPMDFGVMAMVMPVAMLTNTIAYSGLQTTVIHQEILDPTRASALFKSALGWNLLLVGAMALTAPLLARIYSDERVVWLTVAWAALLFVGSLSAMHTALLKRQMRFGAVAMIQLVAAFLGSVAAIVAALQGVGFWSLLLQLAVWRTVDTVLIWIVCDWRPTWRSHPVEPADQGRSFGSYWAGVSGYRLVNWVANQADRVLTGALAGAGALGLYHTSRRWAAYPSTELFAALSDVAVSGFSRVKEGGQYRRYVRRGLMPFFSLSLPATAFLFVEAERVVRVLLGDQWSGAVVFMRLMAIAAFFGGMTRVTEWIYLSRADTGRQFRWSLVYAGAQLTGVVVGAFWGPVGIATGVTAATVLMWVPSLAYALHPSPLGTWDVLGVLLRPALAAVGAVVALSLVSDRLPVLGATVLDLALRGVCFGVAFLLLWAATPGGRSAGTEVLDALGALRRT